MKHVQEDAERAMREATAKRDAAVAKAKSEMMTLEEEMRLVEKQLAEKTARVTRRCSLERLTIARVANKQIQDICGQCPREIPAPERKARRVVFEITATLTSASSECAAEFVLRAYLSVDA